MEERMIPHLPPQLSLDHATARYLEELSQRGFEGEISYDWARRVAGAVDNSVYQMTPAALLYPRHEPDVALVLALLAEERYRAVQLTPRGGGTGTNGQSLNTGLILDLSRHMAEVLELNLEEGWARVQAGVVLDQLNELARPAGLFFAPNLSPSSRATIGGMINTDAAGQGSRVYGKTSDHVLALRCVLLGGEGLDSQSDELSRRLGDRAQQLRQLAQSCAPLIDEQLPQLDRFITGYNLKMMCEPESGQLNLARLISGSEGTLGVVTEATLRLVPIPRARRVLLLRYGSFNDALGSAQALLAHEPTSIETMDHNILGLARADVIYQSVRQALESGDEALDAKVAAVNLVELTGEREEEVEARAQALLESMRPHFGEPGAALGAYLARSSEEQAALWALRKKGVGLLAARPGKRKPVAFVEDSVVPPARLQAYIKDFTALLDEEGLEYGMFGHVDVGCLHVRPALDLVDPEDERRLKRVSDKVHELVQRYGGVIWGEHGKGVRSAYSPEVFGPLYPALQELKALFDPHNQLNPGKVATPAGSDAALMELTSPLRAHEDREIQAEAREAFISTVHCNGNAQCLDYHPHHVMCPSSKVTRDRLHSPKGRATVLRAWLRALSAQGCDLSPDQLSEQRPRPSLIGVGAELLTAPVRAVMRWGRLRLAADDLSHEVYEAMSGCLSCKACATHCPVKVDIPNLKARFLSLYHERYPRPLRDYLVGSLEALASWGSHAPRLFNLLSANPLARAFTERVIGLIDAPRLSERSALKALRLEGAEWASPALLSQLSDEEREGTLILIPDAFNAFFDAQTFINAHRALRALGFRPLIGPFSPNGKGLHVKGRLDAFARCARRHVERLAPLSGYGVELVVIDPAVALTYGDEYPKTIGPLPFEIRSPQTWLAERLEQLPAGRLTRDEGPALLGHCTERALSQAAMSEWRQVFERLGAPLKVEEVSCCGMCGVFGHEREHAEESRGVFKMSWQPKLTELNERGLSALATGYSCRAQVKRMNQPQALHPLSWLAEALANAPSA